MRCLISSARARDIDVRLSSAKFGHTDLGHPRTPHFSALAPGVRVMMAKPNLPRILIADDHTLVAEACKALLEKNYEVVGIVSNGRSLVQAAAKLMPHLVIIDIAMPLLNGLDAGEQIKDLLPKAKLVYVTMNDDPDLVAEAFRRGASGYLLKTCAASELATAVREVLSGKTFISAAIRRSDNSVLHQQLRRRDHAEKLTRRQREVLQLLAEGKAMKEAASALNLAPRTIAFHKYRIMKVLNAKTNSDLVQYAIKHHLIAA